MNPASDLLTTSFVALTLLVAAAYPFGLHVAAGRLDTPAADRRRRTLWLGAAVTVWLVATLMIARSGALAFGPMPPRLALIIVAAAILAVTLSRSGTGRTLATGLPLAALVGIQAFRLPLELIMHRAYTEGLMPVQMSYSGLNFDILTGLSAVILAAALAMTRVPLWVVRAWNWMGCALLLNIVVISILSTPLPFRVFQQEPANVWVTAAPFVWLPTVLVMTALVGHILVFRRLAMESRAGTRVQQLGEPVEA